MSTVCVRIKMRVIYIYIYIYIYEDLAGKSMTVKMKKKKAIKKKTCKVSQQIHDIIRPIS